MAVRLAFCDFLDGIYEVGDTTYALTDVIYDNMTTTPVVDSNGLIAVSYAPVEHHAQAAGPFLDEWLSLYNGDGFTCIMSYSVDADQGNNWIAGLDTTGGPGHVSLITAPSDYNPSYSGVAIEDYYVAISPNPTPVTGGRENAAWQVGLVTSSISTNGGAVGSGSSSPWDQPNSFPNIIFWYGNSPMHIQWIGLYDTTVEVTPGLSRGKPPRVIASGPPLLVGGGVMRRIAAAGAGAQAARGRPPLARRPAWRRRRPPQ